MKPCERGAGRRAVYAQTVLGGLLLSSRVNLSRHSAARCVTKVVQEPAVRPHDLKNRDDRRARRQHAWHSFPSASFALRAELFNVARIFDPALGAAERTGGCSFSVGPQHH